MTRSPTSAHFPDLAELRAWLETMVAAMRFVELVVSVLALVTRMRDVNLELTERLAHLTRKRPRSETLYRLERQLTLPLFALGLGPGESSSAPAGDRKKVRRRSPRAGGRDSFPAHMERVQVVNPVTADQRVCPICGGAMQTVSHSICERFTVIPARILIEQRLDETVACPNDDTIVSAAPPPAIVERGKLTDTLIVEATCDKYLEHLPIERQCQRFTRAGVPIAPQTLGRAVAAHIDLIVPVAQQIAEQTRGPGLLATDSSSIPILDPESNDGIRSGAMWCWTNARWVTFFYSRRGDSDSVREFLGDNFCRTVQCDGTSVTNFIERAGGKRPGCWSHARRGFVDAARAGDQVALVALRKIATLFAVERASTLAGDNAE